MLTVQAISCAQAMWTTPSPKDAQAAELGPDDPRTHRALGLALTRSGQKKEARSELEKAPNLANSDVRFRNQEVRARQELGRMGF